MSILWVDLFTEFYMKTLKQNIRLAVLLCSSLILLNACNSGTSNTIAPTNLGMNNNQHSLQTQKPTKLGDDFFTLLPGLGFDTSSETSVSDQSCLIAAENPTNIQISTPSGYLHYGDSVPLNNLENILGILINGSMSGGVFSNSTNAMYLKNAQEDPYTLKLNYGYQYAGIASFESGAIGTGLSALIPAASALASGTNPVVFRKMCGDSFISQMDAGVFLGLTVSLKFNSNLDKEHFRAALGVNTGFSSIINSIIAAESSTHTSVQMNLRALQLGGDPEKLNSAFNPYDCSDLNSKVCEQMVSNVMIYANSLQAQVTNSNGNIRRDKAAYMSPLIEKYSTININVNAPDPSPEVLAAAQKMVKMYNDARYNFRFTQQYSNLLANYLTPGSLGTLADAENHYQQQFNDIYSGQQYDILKCFRGYISNDCVQVKNQIESALATSPYNLPSYDTELLNYLESSTYEGNIYGYSGKDGDKISDYMLQQCIFYPVSSSLNAQYVLYCGENNFLPITSGGLTITQSTNSIGAQQLNINGLQYDAINPLYPSYLKQINYPNGLILNQTSPANQNIFDVQGIIITGGSSFSTSTGRLFLYQIPAIQN